ncbi:MAG: type IV pilus assembly protein PilM [Candidatus Vogelbacteria bacterium]|nr:type IV pilus assembly protein PilM [Candidatus Vogelbacteria bacterium]
MLLSRFYKTFPVPAYLELSTAGIDISDASIKYVGLRHSPEGYWLDKHGEFLLPPGTVVDGKIVDQQKLIEGLAKIQKKTGWKYVHTALPEEETFVVRLNIPQEKPEFLRDSIELLLEEQIPVPASEVIFDFEVYDTPHEGREEYLLAVYAVPKSVVEGYTGALKAAGFIPASLEVEVQSGVRALIPAGDQGTYMITDLGRTRTSFAIVSRGKVMFTSTVKSVGGEALTRAVERGTGVSFAEAEKMKIKNGLLNSPQNKKVFEALLPMCAILKDETVRHFNFWEGLCQSGQVCEPITKLIFCGGQATLPGLVKYISADLPAKAETGNAWSSLPGAPGQVPPLSFSDSLRYDVAIGLALRGATNLKLN